MRRPIRSFTVELKKPSRGATPDAPAPLTAPPATVEPQRPRAADPNRATAEALFAPQPARAPEAPARAGAGGAPTGRILPSLEEQPSPFADYEPLEHEPRRRGRKPGSKNKPKPAAETTAEPARRGRKPGSKNRPKVTPAPEHWITPDAALIPAEENDEANAAPAPQAPAPAAPLESLRRIGRVARSELPRAERWKARLPRFAR